MHDKQFYAFIAIGLGILVFLLANFVISYLDYTKGLQLSEFEDIYYNTVLEVVE